MRNNKPSFRWATDIWQSSATTDTIYLIMEIGTLQGFAVDTGVRGHFLSSRARERLGRTSMPGGCPSVSCCDETGRKVVARGDLGGRARDSALVGEVTGKCRARHVP